MPAHFQLQDIQADFRASIRQPTRTRSNLNTSSIHEASRARSLRRLIQPRNWAY